MSQTADLELSIHRQDQQSYRVDFRYTDSDPNSQSEVRLGAKQQVLVTFDLPKLNEYLAANQISEYGQALTASLFADESLRTAFGQARATAERSQASLRVRLAIGSNALELHPLRWETLRDPQTGLSLATDQNIYFSRYLSSLDWRPVRLRSRGEVTALAAIAAPSGLEQYRLAPVDRALELETIQAGLGEAGLTVLERGTLTGIVSALTAAEVDILYLVAHGTFAGGEAYLWLEDGQGGIARLPGNELIERIRELEHRPRLVVLASCQSAGRGEGDVLAALGPRLAEAGIPAVLAMQDNLRMDTVKQFMPAFFAEVKKDGRIDRALSVARGGVREQPDWWVPVLFMRLISGRLWYTPGFGGTSGEFEKWPSVLRGIQSGRCTPILGPGLTEALLGPVRDLARNWADELQYPLAAYERESLSHVAQFRAVDQDRSTAEDEWMAQLRAAILKNSSLPAELQRPDTPVEKMLEAAGKQLRTQDEFEPHKVLAGLPVKVFITANTDELLEEALRQVGKKPVTMVCPWREFSGHTDPAMYNRDDEYDPTPEGPLVYHLFGLLSTPESLVLTEDDTFNFLIGITRHFKNIPDQVGRALADSALLFLGFQTEAWDFRVLLHALLAKEGNALLRRHAHIAAQIEPEEGRLLNPGRARRYLEAYFAHAPDIAINIYWGTPREFMRELAGRLAPQQA
jgi:hypothetical protein